MESIPEDQAQEQPVNPVPKGWTHKGTPSPLRVAKPTRLGAIDENGGMSPDVPARSHQRPMQRVLNFAFPPTLHSSRHPPPYTEYNDVTGPNGEKFTDLRRNHRPPRRGGFLRLASIGLLVLAVVVGLAVGLGVGLTRKSTNDSKPYTGPSAPSGSNLTFPAGSYSLTTFLSVVSTACTSNAATWRCYPYMTYNQSTTGAMTTFNWIINPTAADLSGPTTSNSTYMISSSNNPFALTFSNATLSLENAGAENEAYTFGVPMQKIVVPSTALTADNAATECYYNNTLFSAKLFTKMGKSYPVQAGSASGNPDPDPSALFGEWPYAVEVQQFIDGGNGVPDCYKVVNGVKGEKVSVGSATINDSCWMYFIIQAQRIEQGAFNWIPVRSMEGNVGLPKHKATVIEASPNQYIASPLQWRLAFEGGDVWRHD